MPEAPQIHATGKCWWHPFAPLNAVLAAFVWAPPGQIDAYYQYMLKPYDVAAGIVILEEAGGRVTTADGAAYSVFDRSLLATNDALYEQVSAIIFVTGMSCANVCRLAMARCLLLCAHP